MKSVLLKKNIWKTRKSFLEIKNIVAEMKNSVKVWNMNLKDQETKRWKMVKKRFKNN